MCVVSDYIVDYIVSDYYICIYVYARVLTLSSTRPGQLSTCVYVSDYISDEHISHTPPTTYHLPGLGYNTLLFLRLPHLIRVPQLGSYSYLVERHLRTRLGVGMQRASLLLFKVGVVYIILNHWLACGFFSVHRYSERDQSVTYVIRDPAGISTYDRAAGQHDICSSAISFCYARSIYFTVSTMAGIGTCMCMYIYICLGICICIYICVLTPPSL
jgi:hypothetical protein